MKPGEPGASPERAASAENRRARTLALALLGLCWLAVVWPSFSPTLQFGIRDAGRFDWPQKRMIADELAAGRIVSWNPHVALGESAVGAINTAVLDPLNVVLLFAPFPWAFKLLFWICFAAAGLGGWLWLRGRGASPLAAASGACVFMASGYLTGITNNFGFLRALAVVPLFLWLGDRYAERGGVRALAGAALAWAAVLYGGDPQSFGLCGLFLLALHAPRLVRSADRARDLRRFAALGVCAAALAAPVLLPGVWTYLGSDRSSGGFERDAATWSFPPRRLPELAIPHIQDPPDEIRAARPIYRWMMPDDTKGVPWVPSEYVGIVALALALLGVSARTAPAALLALVSLWLAAGPALGASQLGRFVPIWSAFQYPEKLMPWFVLALGLLVAAGIDRIARVATWDAASRMTSRLGLSAIGVATLAGALALASGLAAASPGAWLSSDPAVSDVLGANLTRGLAHVAFATSALAALCFAARSGRLTPLTASAGLALLVSVDLLSAHGVGVTLRDAEMIDSQGPISRWLQEHDPHARINTPFLFSTNVRDGDFEEAPQIRFMARSLAPAWNMHERVHNFGWYGGMAGTRYRVLRELGKADFGVYRTAPGLGAAYFVVPEDPRNLAMIGLDPAAAVAVAHDARARTALVRVPGRPFAYVAERVVAETDSGAVLRGILSPGFATSPVTYVEAPEELMSASACPAAAPEPRPIGVRRTPARIELDVDMVCDGWLVINETLTEGWHAEVDGEPTQIFTANFLASGLPLARGEHVVALRYVPFGVREGAGLALCALLGLALADRREGVRAPPAPAS
jgi:hypothetical protein